ncbi:alcohol dehydrogenase catalytic domain-containing protein [Leucobacter denitrificans]|uniref:Alcohol dehydrogenase catalytic domain-containing protein n=1 Tax=Leucobacter denitrificans TaxID=683042 RepID=A0A7G9S2C1_9MICO|nr:alcohol dehydrogenase catalytic domain-containing protein [Leucobacter denitrificans]QNN61996.1 alcohol dehydrogenase catalytic domain-containing protein [Leucobacter denitrificans]
MTEVVGDRGDVSRRDMRAFVARGGGARIETRELPQPGPNDVIVRTTAASMCSADIATVKGDFDFATGSVDQRGIVVGHEAIGTVHAIGELVEGFEIGDRVGAASTSPCGQCTNCQRGFKGHCGGTIWGGYTAGVSRDGYLAEFYRVTDARENLVRIPDGVSDAAALLAIDTLASGSSGVEAANIALGSTVVVIGQGHVGLAATVTAKLQGAARVIVVKNRPGGEDRARALGATVTLNHTDDDVRAEVLRLTDGAGADLVVEASGSTQAFPLAIELTRLGGTTSVLSSYDGAAESSLSLPIEQWGWGLGDKTILSTFQLCGSERISRLLRLLESEPFDPNVFFTHTYSFDEVGRALTELGDSSVGVLKPLIQFR